MKRLIILLACCLGSSANAADMLIMVRDQPGTVGFRNGDILHVFTATEVARQWSEVEKLGELDKWQGHSRDIAPLSDRVLSRFLILTLADDVATSINVAKWLRPRMTTVIEDGEIVDELVSKRAWALNWREVVPAEYHEDVENPDVPIDLRGEVVIEDDSHIHVRQ